MVNKDGYDGALYPIRVFDVRVARCVPSICVSVQPVSRDEIQFDVSGPLERKSKFFISPSLKTTTSPVYTI